MRLRPWLPGPSAWLALFTTALIATVLIGANLEILRSDVAPHGDAAADMLLIQRAEDGLLLTGHYSRFGFNHPGPFFLLVRHMGGTLLPGLAPYNAQLVGILAVNALFLGLMAGLLARMAGAVVPALAAVAGGVGLFVWTFADLDVLTSSWMPSVLVAPFAAFTLAAPLSFRGDRAALPVASFAGAALVHGYASLALFVAPVWTLALAGFLLAGRRAGGTPDWPALALSGAIITLFIAPLALDVALNPPGNLAAIAEARAWTATLRETDLAEALAFTAGFWRRTPWFVWSAAVVGSVAVVFHGTAGERRTLAAVLGVIALTSLIFVAYAWTAPGPLLEYLGTFYRAVPVMGALAALALASGVAARAGIGPGAQAVPAAAVLVTALAVPAHTTGYRGEPAVSALADAIAADAGGRPVTLGFGMHDHWPLATGVLLELDRRGLPACVAKPGWEVLFTPERVCPPGGPGAAYELLPPADCADACLATVAGAETTAGVAPQGGIPAGPPVSLAATRPPGFIAGWSTPEDWGTWTDGKAATFFVDPSGLKADTLELTLVARGFDAGKGLSQTVDVRVGGHGAGTLTVPGAAEMKPVTLRFPAALLDPEGPTEITLRLPDAASPFELGLGGDRRVLGIAVAEVGVGPAGEPERAAQADSR